MRTQLTLKSSGRNKILIYWYHRIKAINNKNCKNWVIYDSNRLKIKQDFV